MKQLKITTLCLHLIGLLWAYASALKSYENYKVYQVTPRNDVQAQVLADLHYKPKYDFWKDSKFLGDEGDVMVAPEDQANFENEMKRYGIEYEVVVENVEQLFDDEKQQRMQRSFLRTGDVTFSNFMFYGEQMAYVRRLADDYPDKVTVEKIGESYEGRDLLLLHLTSGPSTTDSPKPVIFIDAGIHCREWIAPPVALYIIQQLVENPAYESMYQNVDWYILPNLNPDGYEHTQTQDRLWRKNRRLTDGAVCYGTDLNRNFGFQWMVGGASNNSCSEVYAGPEPFSEPEARAIRDWFLANGENVKLYLTFHSFGEMMLHPWGYTTEYIPDNGEQLHYVGELAATAINQFSTIGSSYVTNSSAILLGVAAGGSDDWVKDYGVDLTYCIELPDGDSPFFFMIPARQISPVVQETFEGVKAMHYYIEETYWNNVDDSFIIQRN